MNGINEKIKHAVSEDEIESLLAEGEKQPDVSTGTLNRRMRLADNRRTQLRRKNRIEAAHALDALVKDGK